MVARSIGGGEQCPFLMDDPFPCLFVLRLHIKGLLLVGLDHFF